jgi:hypothetical protein
MHARGRHVRPQESPKGVGIVWFVKESLFVARSRSVLFCLRHHPTFSLLSNLEVSLPFVDWFWTSNHR